MNRTFAPFVITAMTASSMSLTGSCRRQVYWSDSAKLLVASDTIAACRDRRQEIRKFLTSLAKILRSSSGYGLNSMSNSKNIEDATPNRALKNSASRLLKKGPDARRERKSTSGGVFTDTLERGPPPLLCKPRVQASGSSLV